MREDEKREEEGWGEWAWKSQFLGTLGLGLYDTGKWLVVALGHIWVSNSSCQTFGWVWTPPRAPQHMTQNINQSKVLYISLRQGQWFSLLYYIISYFTSLLLACNVLCSILSVAHPPQLHHKVFSALARNTLTWQHPDTGGVGTSQPPTSTSSPTSHYPSFWFCATPPAQHACVDWAVPPVGCQHTKIGSIPVRTLSVHTIHVFWRCQGTTEKCWRYVAVTSLIDTSNQLFPNQRMGLGQQVLLNFQAELLIDLM